MVFRWSFAFTRKGLEDVFKEVLKTSSGRRLGNVLKKGRHDFHFRPTSDVFETKIKTFLRRHCVAWVNWSSCLPSVACYLFNPKNAGGKSETHLSWKFNWNSSSRSGDLKIFYFNINYFHWFFGFLVFLCCKETNDVSI